MGLLGANILSQFGAQVFVVDLIGIAVLREFNVLITAILLAGRSSSSFAAEIGAMKMKQEIESNNIRAGNIKRQIQQLKLNLQGFETELIALG